ncbi:3-dehydroquinate synthase [Catalinimonas alkaloidigena]|uniref:3-dehydroquinate synthase n=1 Tax=Catalinimonas alkaloidigena TaxID=1075417 RepID=A0A1G9ABQ0_9BACT|nr:3-dehydroquinate synthase [Catalinimonas alkaloidigena]SDK24698.1 3-dehydroquinate synthase [Catalinimonas alkaloidigena]
MTQTTTLLIQENIGPTLAQWLADRSYSKIAVLTDTNTQRDCYPLLAEVLPPHVTYTVPAGEQHKHLATCQQIWHFLTEQQFDRHGVVLNLGGGVMGDMGGFCAATYKRGVDFVQLPTTLLAQVDASVGGKLGVDFEGYKNHVGVFAQPAAVLIGTDFLRTLPTRELRSGFAEVIKHCLIADAQQWEALRQVPFAQQDWLALVEHSVAIKSGITERDPKEKGERKLLNFGHTVGHAVESWLLAHPDRAILHGEAIAVGMICEGYLSVQQSGLSEADFRTMQTWLLDLYGKVTLSADDIAGIVPLARQDKKNRDGIIRSVLLEAPGRARYDQSIAETAMVEALAYYQTA